MAYENAKRADHSAKNAPGGRTDDVLVAIILAATAAEAFLNDMAGCIRFLAEMPGRPPDEAFNRLSAVGEALNSLEDDRAQTLSKYLVASVLLGCQKIRRESEPFQSFDQVVTLRNAIVHAKPVSPDDMDAPARVVKSLAQRGLCSPVTENASNLMGMETWWVVMRTAPVSWWAAKSANRLMLALADSLIDIADVDGALAGFRKVLQDDLVYAESQHGGPPK
jgi:hypothetical protein